MYSPCDNPNPPVKETVRTAVLTRYLQQCIAQIDWKAAESAEAELALQTLQEIFSAMQNGTADDAALLLQIDDIFVRRLGQYTEKGLKLRARRHEEATDHR